MPIVIVLVVAVLLALIAFKVIRFITGLFLKLLLFGFLLMLFAGVACHLLRS